LLDGPRNAIVLMTGVLDTSNEAKTTKVTVANLAALNDGRACTRVSIEEVEFSVSGTLKVILAWKATTDVTFCTMVQSGEFCFGEEHAPVLNNAGTGVTGDINLTTVGWSAGTETYTVLLKMRKH